MEHIIQILFSINHNLFWGERERERDGDNAQRSGGQTRQVSVDDIKSNYPEINEEVAAGNGSIHFKMERNEE